MKWTKPKNWKCAERAEKEETPLKKSTYVRGDVGLKDGDAKEELDKAKVLS